MHHSFRKFLLTGAALAALSSPVLAQDPRLSTLEQQLRDVRAEIAELKKAQAEADNSAAVTDLKRSSGDRYTDLSNQIAALPKVGLDNGRLTVTSADGAFSVALRALLQYDYGYFAQGRGAPAVDLSSGGNFRRAQIGVTGTAWRVWSYNFTFDFGGNGLENPGYIYNAYIQYDGLKPFGFRIGAYTPAGGLEDQTGSADLIFLERPAVVDAARNIAGAPGRSAVSIFAQDTNYFVSASLTGDKVNTGATRALNAAPFDEQIAFVGRASWLAVNSPDIKWLLDAGLTHVFKPADSVAGSVAVPGVLNNFNLAGGPDLAIDTTRTVTTGNMDVDTVTQYNFESAAEYDALYLQGGWFNFHVERRNTAIPSPDFSGWYVAATWSLTGETHPYDAATASFRQIRPVQGLGSGGIGAWEIKARYSHFDLDFDPLATAAAGAITGGVQDVWTVGLNWYATNGVRFALDYNNIKVNRVNAPANDLSADAVALRAQLSL
jgi:phosphate-selective porin OprO and OprP